MIFFGKKEQRPPREDFWSLMEYGRTQAGKNSTVVKILDYTWKISSGSWLCCRHPVCPWINASYEANFIYVLVYIVMSLINSL